MSGEAEGVKTRAPATTANLGPGFDCAAVALDLWNEVEVTEGGDEPPNPTHIGIRAFGLVASPEGLSFSWSERIPRARGLGSSAATIALGLVAAAKWSGEELELEDLLARGAPLEGHSDNLAACLAGGACLTWSGHIARLAATLPLTPVAVIPREQVRTPDARDALPPEVPHVARPSTPRGRHCSGQGSRGATRACSRPRSRTACTSPTGPRRFSTRSAPTCLPVPSGRRSPGPGRR